MVHIGRSTHPTPRRTGWRTALAAIATATAAAAMVAIAPTDASAATVDPTAWYELVNRNSGKALEVCSVSTADATQSLGGAVTVERFDLTPP